MMNNEDYLHFVCIVAGENPDSLMEPYDKNKKVEKYLVYRYKDAEKIKNRYVEEYKKALKGVEDDFQKMMIEDEIETLQEMDNDVFFDDLVENFELETDPDTGDAYSTANKNGQWSSYRKGKMLSIPFLTKDGNEVFQARKGDVAWDKIHLAGSGVYKRAWEMVMEGSKPKDDYEQVIYDNMSDKESYFKKFETKENYVISCTAFWGYAFVSEKTGWIDASDNDQFAWMSNFYDLYIKNLPDDTLLTIFECRR